MNSPLHPSTPAPQHILVTGGAGKSILLKILSRITELTPLGPPGTGEAGRAESKAWEGTGNMSAIPRNPLSISKSDLHDHLQARMAQCGITFAEIQQVLQEGWQAIDCRPGTLGKVLVFFLWRRVGRTILR